MQTKEEKNSERDGFLTFQEKDRSQDLRQVSLLKEWRDEQRDVDQIKDCFTKQEQKDWKICLQF